MKKALFVLLIGTILFAGCTTKQTAETVTPTDTSVVASSSPSTEKIAGFTAEDVASHSSSADCWIIIDGSVYDVTSFLNRHEGGADVIINECGKDASTAFHTMDGSGRDHPQRAQRMLSEFYKGLLQK